MGDKSPKNKEKKKKKDVKTKGVALIYSFKETAKKPE